MDSKQYFIPPSDAIHASVKLAIKELYGKTWDPRVVRQNKKLNVGTLLNIDYAVPCFELARSVGEPSSITAKKIKKCLSDKESNTESLQIESVGGFVNFELSNDYLISSVRNACRQYTKNEVSNYKGLTNFVIFEPKIISTAPRQEITAIAYKYLDQLHRLFGYEMESKFLLSDYSAETLDYMLSKKQLKTKSKSPSEKKTFNHELFEQQSTINALNILRNRLLKYNLPKVDQARSRYDYVLESSITLKTHSFLDGLTSRSTPNIVKDDANKAVYLVIGNDALPLRSSRGLLFRAAYYLYLVDYTIQSIRDYDSLVLIAPQNLHLFARMLIKNSKSKKHQNIIFFDPSVSKADIEQIHGSISAISIHFRNLARILKYFEDSNKISSKSRADVLFLVDFPAEIKRFILKNQLPSLFDSINQSIYISNKLKVLATDEAHD